MPKTKEEILKEKIKNLLVKVQWNTIKVEWALNKILDLFSQEKQKWVEEILPKEKDMTLEMINNGYVVIDFIKQRIKKVVGK